MKTLVVGSGGREHAIVKALKNSASVTGVWAWPGNDGILQDAEPVPVQRNQFHDLGEWCVREGIDLAVIGPENELVAGISDELREMGIKVFGPDKEASQLEGSKIFAKNFMRQFGVPTGRAIQVSDVKQALAAASEFAPPYVLKADGLAAGKGVFICKTKAELEESAALLFQHKKLGPAGETALVEEFQPGEELSVLVMTNGKEYSWLPLCRDHKRLKNDDEGPNTGGMGVIGPVSIDKEQMEELEREVIQKSIKGLSESDFLFRGVLFIGVMLTPEGPRVLEYNVRFGDPETQVIMPMLDGDWGQQLMAVAEGRMLEMKWKNQSVACIVLAAEGYPDSPVPGVLIEGELNPKEAQVLHAGTRKEDGEFVTNGGRVLNVLAVGIDQEDALKKAYKVCSGIKWPGMQYRTDIGQ